MEKKRMSRADGGREMKEWKKSNKRRGGGKLQSIPPPLPLLIPVMEKEGELIVGKIRRK
jgi:hypothetical protein